MSDNEAMRQPEIEQREEAPAAPATTKRWLFIWQSEYLALVAAVLLVTTIAFAFFYFDLDIAELKTYGYLGVFAISVIGASSIILPMPSIAAIFGGSVLLDPLFGIPTPLLVGLVAGLGEAIGEFTGYAAGYGGSPVIKERAFYRFTQGWMTRHGSITMFVFSSIPNPLFDVAGIIAGASRMPIWRFFFSVWAGKTVKGVLVAITGVVSLGFFEGLFD